MFGRKSHMDSQGRRILRKDRRGMDPFRAGVLALLVMSAFVYLGFTKNIPFINNPFEFKAVFEQSNSLRANSPVRIAGVNVGKVRRIERLGNTDNVVVTMAINKKGLPIHKDAQLKIRPRIFLEGNYFVDIKPGTPSAPKIDDDDTIPITQTATPVQLDQILTTLQSDQRQDLKDLLEGYGKALTYKPTEADDVGQDPDVRGQTAAESLNDALKYGGDAFRDSAIVNDALQGTEPDDLSKLIAGLGKTAAGLDQNEEQLKDLITNFNTTMAAFASQEGSLRAAIHELGPTIDSANNAFASLNAAFPSTRAFAREILPGVRETPATITAAFPWIDQATALVQPEELGNVVRDFSPATRDLAQLTDKSLDLLPQTDLVAKCFRDVILPTGDVVIDDGALSSGMANYKEFWYTMVGLAGEGQNFDGNGIYIRFQAGGGDQTVSTGTVGGKAGSQLYGNALAKPLGTRPAYTGKRPPYKPNVPCYKNTPPNLNGPAGKVGPVEQVVGNDNTLKGYRVSDGANDAAAREDQKSTSGGSVAEQIASSLNPFAPANNGKAGGKAK